MDGYATPIAGLVRVKPDLDEALESELIQSSTLVFRVAYSVLRHRQDAEDVAQEALVRACRRFHQVRQRDRFRAWLVRVTWRLALDRRRADKRRLLRDDTHARHQPLTLDGDGTAGSIERERAAALWRAIDELPEKLRVVVVLANIQEHDLDEVATLLRLPIGTVKSRLFAARTKLKDLLS